MSLSRAVETAVKMETDALKFYSDAKDRVSHPLGKKIFDGFVSDEARHLRMLKDILNDLEINTKDVHLGEDIKTIFTELKDGMMKRVTATTDEIEAVKIALDFEKEGYDFYEKAAREAEDEKEKRLFEVLTAEERKHYEILDNTYTFLKDTGEWFMWKEHGILEG
jgi:rubrerythrin